MHFLPFSNFRLGHLSVVYLSRMVIQPCLREGKASVAISKLLIKFVSVAPIAARSSEHLRLLVGQSILWRTDDGWCL
jgi:hypothetical protein